MADKSSPATSRRHWGVALGLSLGGLALAAKLTQLHHAIQENPATKSFCSVSEHVDCDVVAQSMYAVWFGVPVAVVGLVAYLVLVVVTLWGIKDRSGAALVPLTLLSSCAFLVSLVLAGVSAFALHTLCLLCAGTWLVDLALFALALWMGRQGGFTLAKDALFAFIEDHGNRFWGAVGLTVAGSLFIFASARSEAARGSSSLLPASSSMAKGAHQVLLPVGRDAQGHYYMGASEPKLAITVFSDYQCPHCARWDEMLHKFVEKHPTEIRVTHRTFPLDQQCNPLITSPFHAYSCRYAMMAACAGEQGKFLVASDYLFAHGREETPVTTAVLAKAAQIDAGVLDECVMKRGPALIKDDVDRGIELHIEGTPTFLVDGRIFNTEQLGELLKPYMN